MVWGIARLLAVALLVAGIVPVSARSEALAPAGGAATRIALDQMAIGLDRPVFLTNAGDGTDRLFVVEKKGRIRIIQGGQLLATPFLDIQSRVEDSGNEQGLLSVAFHPDYATNRRFFVYYTTNSGDDGDIVVAEYAASTGNPNVANTTEKPLLRIPHSTFENHNGGLAAFGPDGYLYLGVGDGGSANDPDENGQNINSLLAKILRIDVNSGSPYGIPPDNPFAGATPGRDEIYAYGLRNPWRYSFDRATGALWCGDVGQNQWEEVDVITKGGNYGWNVMEGFHCRPPTTGCDQSGLVLPLFEYSHDGSNGVPGGCSITGGYVYRGSAIPSLVGTYVFADYCTGSGSLYVLAPGASAGAVLQTGGPFEPVTSFGEDESGELYVLTDSVFGGAGRVLKIVLQEGACDIGCPSDVTVEDVNGDGTETVSYAPPSSNGTCGSVTCVPASGSSFTAGTTTVTCSSTTGGGSCSFAVTVNSPVLAVSSIEPASARRKQSVTVVIGGSGFAPGAAVSFGSKIAVNAVRVTSATSIEADIKVKKKAARGARGVSVTNPGGAQAACEQCFTVQ